MRVWLLLLSTLICTACTRFDPSGVLLDSDARADASIVPDAPPPDIDAPPPPPEWTVLSGVGNLRPAFVVLDNGDMYAVVGPEAGAKTVCKWNPETGVWEPQTVPNDNLEPALVIDPNGAFVANVGASICRWNPVTQVWDPIAPASGSTVFPAFEYEADDNIRAIVDGAVQQWNGLTWTPLSGPAGSMQPAFAYVDGSVYAVLGPVDGPKTVRRWNPDTFAWDPQTSPNDNLRAEFVIDPNGSIVANVGNSICRWNPDTSAWDPIARAPQGSVMEPAFKYVDDNNIQSIIDSMVYQWALPEA